MLRSKGICFLCVTGKKTGPMPLSGGIEPVFIT